MDMTGTSRHKMAMKTKTISDLSGATDKFPTLAQLIEEGRQETERIKQATHSALMSYLRQGERLNIAHGAHQLRGTRFLDFAHRLGGYCKSDAYALRQLAQHRETILSRCQDQRERADREGRQYEYPGWVAALKMVLGSRAHYGYGGTDERGTPQQIFDHYHRIYGFDLDACASPDNAKCAKYITKETDCRKVHWDAKAVWVNPPYGLIESILRKARTELNAGRCEMVFLLSPVYTDALWFHTYCIDGEITFLQGRIVFEGHGKQAPFPSMTVKLARNSARKHNLLHVRVEKTPRKAASLHDCSLRPPSVRKRFQDAHAASSPVTWMAGAPSHLNGDLAKLASSQEMYPTLVAPLRANSKPAGCHRLLC